MAALPILKKGCCWRVRDGYSIRIHKDRWIPNHPTNKVLYLASEDTDGMLVADILDPDPHCWRRELITSLFHTDDAEACRGNMFNSIESSTCARYSTVDV